VSPFTTLFDFRQFQSGWWAGWAFLPVVAFAGWVVVTNGRTRRAPWGLVGPAWVLGSLLALDGWLQFPEHLVDLPNQLIWGLVAVAAANELASHTPNPKIIGCLLVLPGAYLVATASDFHGPDWVVPLVTVTVTIGGPMAADLDRRGARLGLGPVMWLITVFGVYATVPDTELIRPLVGVAIPLALCGWPLRVARLGAGGAAAGIALLMWVGAAEGYGRPGSIVGAAAALGLFLVEPVGRALLRRRVVPWSRVMSTRRFVLVFLAVHLLLVAYGTRIAGFQAKGGAAFALWVPALVVGVALGGLLGLSKRVRPTRPRQKSRGASHPSRSQPPTGAA
jgi:hypothetical protein